MKFEEAPGANMDDVERLITEWRKTMITAPNVGPETVDELENHLRENVDQLVRSGMTAPEAFQRAVRQLGSTPALASEFQKLDQSTWLPVQVVTGVGVSAALLLVFLFARSDNLRSNFLLASHVFMVTLGYMTVFLCGALGICFVCQRCFSEFSLVRLQFLSRISFIFGCVAAGLTALGTALGMFWARAEWGRFWAWDPKQIGALCVVAWLICFLFAHRLSRTTARGVLVMSIMGNVVVSLGWFGANLLGVLHSYGTPHYPWLLLAAVICNLAVFLVGLAPAGWLHFRTATRQSSQEPQIRSDG